MIGIDKLLELVRQGCGTLFKPLEAVLRAAAAKQEIRALIGEGEKHNLIPESVEYIGAAANIVLAPSSEPQLLSCGDASDLGKRAAMRMAHREMKAQENVETTLLYAAAELHGESDVPDDEIEEDWVTRFFGIIEEVSSDEARQLWGKVLAGEIRKPGSFSLRTLEVLRGLSQQEAALFQTFCQHVVWLRSTEVGAVPSFNSRCDWLAENGIPLSDILKLDDAGLVMDNDRLVYYLDGGKLADGRIGLANGPQVLVLHFKPDAKVMQIPCTRLTEAGIELSTLIDVEGNKELMLKLAVLAKGFCNRLELAELVRFGDGGTYWKNACEIPETALPMS